MSGTAFALGTLPAIPQNSRMRLKTLLIILLISKTSFSQLLSWEGEDLENKFYYPSKKVFIDNKVKFKIDSNIYSLPRGYTIEAFDEKGRLIGLFNHSIDSFINPYQYIEKGDTLICIRRRNRDNSIYMLEKFIYNSSGQIIQFDRFIDDFSSKGTLEFNRTIFYYENSNVSDKLRYSLNGKDTLTINTNITTYSMKLWSVKHYTYQKAKSKNIMVITECIGNKDFRSVDTFEYDKLNRLLLHTNFAKSAYLFCSYRASNVRRIEKYNYRNDSVLIKSYTTTEAIPPSNSSEEQDLNFRIEIYSKNGLELRNYHGYKQDKIEIYDRIKYLYY